jgi:hypothetical protein
VPVHRDDRCRKGKADFLHEETFVSVVGVTEVTGYLTQFVCCVGRIRISLTLTRCGWLTA